MAFSMLTIAPASETALGRARTALTPGSMTSRSSWSTMTNGSPAWAASCSTRAWVSVREANTNASPEA